MTKFEQYLEGSVAVGRQTMEAVVAKDGTASHWMPMVVTIDAEGHVDIAAVVVDRDSERAPGEWAVLVAGDMIRPETQMVFLTVEATDQAETDVPLRHLLVLGVDREGQAWAVHVGYRIITTTVEWLEQSAPRRAEGPVVADLQRLMLGPSIRTS